ncbi:MAG TPA: hypothetical protein VFT29_10950 [Gemmatimonadaceae bacterium]|nr:hypothetical protein [Gemmatimonadaceae bacterium]
MSDPGAVLIAGIVLGSATLSIRAIVNGVVRLQENKLKHASAQKSTVTEARLERIEQAVDSIAIEIERISEGQRFTTKLLSERTTSAR